MTREELWDLQYRERPYLRHATEEQLHVRLFDIINNRRNSTYRKQNWSVPPKFGGEYWMSRFSHVLEELGLRGRGIPPMSDFAHELRDFVVRSLTLKARFVNIAKLLML